MVGASGLRGNQGWGESGMLLRFSFPGVPADEVYVTRRLATEDFSLTPTPELSRSLPHVSSRSNRKIDN